jgi:hypothetical protein
MHLSPNLLHLKWRLYLEERARWNELNREQPAPENFVDDCPDFECMQEKLNHPHWEVRCSVAKNLGRSQHESAGEALVDLLQDAHLSVRWAAIESLTHKRRDAIKPLLSALTRHYDSPTLRISAHHVLLNLHHGGHLKSEEIAVLNWLEGNHSPLEMAKSANQALISGIETQ